MRENTEGEYAGVGGRSHRGLPGEVGIEVSVFTRAGCERVLRLAFECAAERRGLLTSATKSNASRYGYVLWDEVAAELAAEFPAVRYERVLVDALAARMVRSPDSLDVVVASNLFADILTDLGAAIQGGMGMAASANIGPGTSEIGIFEPVHGSAPDIAGQGIANPAGAIWSAVLMLEHLGEAEAAARLLGALERRAQGAEDARRGRHGDDARGRRRRRRRSRLPLASVTCLARSSSAAPARWAWLRPAGCWRRAGTWTSPAAIPRRCPPISARGSCARTGAMPLTSRPRSVTAPTCSWTTSATRPSRRGSCCRSSTGSARR